MTFPTIFVVVVVVVQAAQPRQNQNPQPFAGSVGQTTVKQGIVDVVLVVDVVVAVIVSVDVLNSTVSLLLAFTVSASRTVPSSK